MSNKRLLSFLKRRSEAASGHKKIDVRRLGLSGLTDRQDMGTVATNVLPTDTGGWTIQISYLSGAGSSWRAISVYDDGEEEGEEWRQ
jgi:hypothetical protein